MTGAESIPDTATDEAVEVHHLAVDGEDLVVLWTPPRPRQPTILYFHGFGSSQDGEKATYFRRRAVAAGLGFCSLDFRGHGRSGGRLGAVTFSRNLEDGAAVLTWLGERLPGDGSSPRVFFGSSMGGAVAFWLAARHPGAFAAGLAVAPALDMGPALRDRLGPEGVETWRRTGRFRFVNERVDDDLDWALLEDLEGYPAQSLAERHATPALIFQGMGDDSVDWRRSVELAEAVRRRNDAGAQVEVHLFSGGDHRLLEYRPRLWEMAVRFLDARGLLGESQDG